MLLQEGYPCDGCISVCFMYIKGVVSFFKLRCTNRDVVSRKSTSMLPS